MPTEVSKNNYDFCGYATRNDIRCSDGRTIRRDAFKDCDGMIVPIVYQHDHMNIDKVLGHGMLENREDGVYIYGLFNDTDLGDKAKKCVAHGDIRGLSIYANQLKQKAGDVLHGVIREVSLVLAGANPGAYIESVVCHGEESDEEMTAWVIDEKPILLHTAEEQENNMAEEKTVKEIFDDAMDKLSEQERNVIYSVIGYAGNQEAEHSAIENQNEGDTEMNHVFENADEGLVLSHSDKLACFTEALEYAKAQKTTLKSALEDSCLAHGIDDIDMLFPDYKELNNIPEFINNETDWVAKVMKAVKHVPFAKIRTTFADISEGEARAKGYITGNRKKEEFFKLARRQTGPTTVYKLQKMNRDDIIDITGFDVVAWLKGEMRMKLDEELARAFLFGDGRNADDPDKIDEECIRPVWGDDSLFTVTKAVTIPTNATEDQESRAIIRAIKKARKDRRYGTGKPTFYTSSDIVTNALLLEDNFGHPLYDTVEKLASAIGVSEIVEVDGVENMFRVEDGETHKLAGLLVNLADYNVGADKGGQIESFEDFDLDFNKYEYLTETRCSGALVKPYSAVALEIVHGLLLKIMGEDPAETVLGKTVGDVQEDIFVNDNWISGVSKYVDNWDAYETGAKGNFIVLKFDYTDGATVKVKNSLTGREVELDADKQAVIKITNNRTQKVIVTISKEGESDIVRTLSLASVRCQAANA